jgi:hypothetical protein
VAKDGTKATVDQMATDVSAFLVWTAEPKLEKRHQTGWPVIGFLILPRCWPIWLIAPSGRARRATKPFWSIGTKAPSHHRMRGRLCVAEKDF